MGHDSTLHDTACYMRVAADLLDRLPLLDGWIGMPAMQGNVVTLRPDINISTRRRAEWIAHVIARTGRACLHWHACTPEQSAALEPGDDDIAVEIYHHAYLPGHETEWRIRCWVRDRNGHPRAWYEQRVAEIRAEVAKVRVAKPGRVRQEQPDLFAGVPA